MGSIRKAPRTAKGRKSAVRWEARYRDTSGRQRTRTFDFEADAKAFLSTVEADVIRGMWVDPSGARLGFDEWIADWWSTTTHLRRSTRVRDRGLLDRYVRPTFRDHRLGAITQPEIRAWVASLSARGLAPATVHLAYGLLSRILSAAVDAGLIGSTPCRKIPLPRIEREEMRFLDSIEVETLAQAIDQRYRALVLVGCYGGLRIGELAGLRRSRVDLLRGTIDVAEIADETGGHLTYGPPKTRASRRVVSLPRPVIAELEDRLIAVTDPTALVFPAPEGGGLRVNSWRRRFWLPAVMAAGLEPLRPHDMRHTAVALWIAAGASPLEVARRAGHTSTSFTLDRYGHLFPAADEILRGKLEAMMTGVPQSADSRVVSIDVNR